MVECVDKVAKHKTVTKIISNKSLSEAVRESLEAYFSVVDESNLPNNLYQIVLEQIEKPLITSVMKFCANNQCKAAKLLGMNRNTLRKKLLLYKLIKKKYNE